MEDAQATQGSSGIHKVTSSVTDHIKFLIHSDNYPLLYPVVTEAAGLGKYVPQIGDLPHLDSWVMEMVSCLEGKLAIMSETFPDQGLRFLFLLNNSDSVLATLHDSTRYSSFQAHVAALCAKAEGYMQSYLEVSWSPLLSCLFNPQPFCLFGKYCYPLALPKFEAEFHKMYTTQKLWKVPDPELRTNLRIAVIDKIIPGYT
ncbi:hypothetical protein U9M48_026123 [Paspalum notatum var. saurae]|uniref:Exocyst subunit Exo70 family protein n=1 Tax=Paspalum notatum var. saurae TaxID=547442 RepID=A0AAQ3TVK4_PASNO